MADRKNAEAERESATFDSAAASAEAEAATAVMNLMLIKGDAEKMEKAREVRLEADKRAREAELRRIKALEGDDADVLWVLSNRLDDRVVLNERDARHPGGEAFVGGPAPEHVFRTPMVAQLLNDGLLIEVPEPREGLKRPLALSAAGVVQSISAQPGQVVRLGRTPDPDLFDEGAKRQIAKSQEEKPSEIAVPAGVIVPKAPSPERESAARR